MSDQLIISEERIKDFLSHTKSLVNHVYWFTHDLSLMPNEEHYGATINFTDIKLRDVDFLNELINTITSWIYSKQQVGKIIKERLIETNNDISNAYTFLASHAFSKFRVGHPQGQFGELLLFNLIQHFFEAVPLLRKMRITTSVGHERFGADAIHVKIKDNTHQFILGESKCYESKYKFKDAFKNSLTSIIDTFSKFDEELNLYVYDDFIEPELEKVARMYKSGELKNVKFQLVCLVIYNETNGIDGANESEIKKSINEIIHQRCKGLDEKLFKSIETKILNRMNYIIFPVWKLDELLAKFSRLIGGANAKSN